MYQLKQVTKNYETSCFIFTIFFDANQNGSFLEKELEKQKISSYKMFARLGIRLTRNFYLKKLQNMLKK